MSNTKRILICIGIVIVIAAVAVFGYLQYVSRVNNADDIVLSFDGGEEIPSVEEIEFDIPSTIIADTSSNLLHLEARNKTQGDFYIKFNVFVIDEKDQELLIYESPRIDYDERIRVVDCTLPEDLQQELYNTKIEISAYATNSEGMSSLAGMTVISGQLKVR